MNVVRRAFRNISYLFVFQIASRFLGLVLNVALARWLQAAGFGRYSLILVIIMIAGMAADFGTANIVIREVSRRRQESNSLLASALVLRLLTTVTVTAAVAVSVILAGVATDFAAPLIIATAAIIPTSLSTAFESSLLAFERMDLSAMADAVFSLVLTAVGVTVVYKGGGVTAMTEVYLGASVARLGYSSLMYRRLDRPRGGWRFTRDHFFYMVRESFPVLYWQLVSLAYYKIDMLILGALRTEAEVGWYAAAYKMFEVPVMFGWLAMQALLPLMSQTYYSSTRNLEILFEKVIKYVWIVGLGVAVPLTVLSSPIIGLLFPPDFSPAINVLILLGYTVPFMVGTSLFGNLFIAMNLQGKVARWSLVSLAANVGFNLALIPHFGIMGAAASTLLADVISFIFFYGFLARYLRGVNMVEVFLMPSVAAGVLLVPLILLRGVWGPVPGIIGILAYPLILLGLRVISSDDVGYFRRLRVEG